MIGIEPMTFLVQDCRQPGDPGCVAHPVTTGPGGCPSKSQVGRAITFVWGWVMAISLMSLAATQAQEDIDSQPNRPESTDSRVVVVTIDGSRVTVPAERLSAEGVGLADGAVLSWDEVRELQTGNRLLGDDPDALTVRLRDQGVLYARQVSMTDGQLLVATDLTDIQYPLVDVRSIRFAAAEGEAEWAALLREPSGEIDRLLVTTSRGPRVVAGLLESLDAEGVQLYFEEASRRVGRDKILGIVPAALEESAAPKFLVQVVDRSVLIADSLTVTDGNWQIGWQGKTQPFPQETIVSVRVRSDRVLYVSDLTPVLDEVQTVIAPAAKNRVDTNVVGQPLTLRLPVAPAPTATTTSSTAATAAEREVRVFSKGWGTRSRSRLVFDLPPDFQRLSGWVGIDHSTQGRGNCQAIVLVDDIQVFSQTLRGDATAFPLDIAVQGGRRLELRVETGEELDLADWVNWADLRLLK